MGPPLTKSKDSMSALKSHIAFRVYETLFFGTILLIGYWLVTLNWLCLAGCAVVTFLQSFANDRSNSYIKFVTNVLEIPRFFNITRHYEEPVPEDEKTMFAMHPHSVYAYGNC